jgi:eukaryotic-like serine/threonine-protein kinase
MGEAGETRYLAYEYVSGGLLSGEMGGRPMNARRALDLAVQVADALADVHAAGMLHADLRPATIAMTGKGSAKLLDTGMSRWTRGGNLRRAAADDASTLPADAVAVIRYMSPEQSLGGVVDGRSDLFSLASVVYEMLTGRTAFNGASVQDTVLSVISYQPAAASTLNPEVLPELDAILARAFSKDISRRHQSVAAFAAELRSVISSLEAAPQDQGGSYVLPVDDGADRMPMAVWLAGLAAAVTVAAIVWWTLK